MFVTEYVNDWGELTYLPTTLSKVLLTLVLLALLVGASLLASKGLSNENSSDSNEASNKPAISKKGAKFKLTTKQLAFCAMSIALGTVLSNIKLFHFPTGGSITLLSMLVITLPGYFFGLLPGLMTGVAYGVLQLIIDPYVLFPAQLIVDYLLAFGALGLSGLFYNKKNGLVLGYISAILGRYIFAVLSGWIFFGSYAWDGWGALPYSLVYNGIYIFAEAFVTVIILLIPAVNKTILKIKDIANKEY